MIMGRGYDAHSHHNVASLLHMHYTNEWDPTAAAEQSSKHASIIRRWGYGKRPRFWAIVLRIPVHRAVPSINWYPLMYSAGGFRTVQCRHYHSLLRGQPQRVDRATNRPGQPLAGTGRKGLT